MEKQLDKKKLHPTQVIIISFLLAIVIGALLLSLPFATVEGKSVSLLDAFFTSTSAVCVTGLIVVDTGATYTLFGQIVILCLLQIGGLGVMTITSFVFLLVGKRITLSERMIIRESLNEFDLSGLVRIVKRILIVTFSTELVGAAIFAIRFVPLYGLRGVFLSVFHAVSAFCNAGFDVMGSVSGDYAFQSMSMFRSDPLINFTLMALIVIGGLGFVVVTNIFDPARIRAERKLTRHSRLVLTTSVVLLGFGALAVLLLEFSNPATLGASDTGTKVMGSLFQAVTPRTAGFSTIDQGGLMPTTKLITMFLMFVGASPAGTGGGIKTTTLAILLMYVWSGVTGHRDVTMMERRIAGATIRRAITIAVLGFMFVILAAFSLLAIEGRRFAYEDVFFEAYSAFGTVGLSAGITSSLAAASRVIIMIVMFAGRVGLLTLTFAFANRSINRNAKIRYPEERFMVG